VGRVRGEITGVVVMAPGAEVFKDHAHITLLAPFGAISRFDGELVARLRKHFAMVSSFDFELTAVREFPDGVVYLAPEPAAPFRKLTEALVAEFPDFPPYDGAFAEIIPHCTIEAERRHAASAALPIAEHATRAHLVYARTENDWQWIATLPFAPADADASGGGSGVAG
jgi:2'-5' RNA ligase